MNKTDIETLKDIVYELEGLLELATLREDKITELEPLIRRKLQALTETPTATGVPLSSFSSRPAMSKPAMSKPAFCINDRFRFRRELFNDSDTDFSNAMNIVATLDNYNEAENYFLVDLAWDPDDPTVHDFMQIIHTYFQN